VATLAKAEAEKAKVEVTLAKTEAEKAEVEATLVKTREEVKAQKTELASLAKA